MKGRSGPRYDVGGKLQTTTIAGVKSGNRSNPHVLKIANESENRRNYASGGACGMAEGGSARPRLDRPGRKIKRADGGPVRDAVARGVNTVGAVENFTKGYRDSKARTDVQQNVRDAARKVMDPDAPDNEDSSIAKRASGGWIKGAIKHPGSLHRSLHVPEGEKIPAKKLEKAEHSENPKLARKANLAKTLKGLHKG